MKVSKLAFAAVLAAVAFSFPFTVRAEGGGKDGDAREEMGDNRVRPDDRDEGRGDRDRGDGAMGREGREGPRGPRDADPEIRAKIEKMREIEHKAVSIAKSLRQGSDAEKAAAKSELRKVVGELFDQKIALESVMLEKLEKHVAELKAKIAKKKASREKAISSRVARMTGEDDEWE
jgi:hypothetical protein